MAAVIEGQEVSGAIQSNDWRLLVMIFCYIGMAVSVPHIDAIDRGIGCDRTVMRPLFPYSTVHCSLTTVRGSEMLPVAVEQQSSCRCHRLGRNKTPSCVETLRIEPCGCTTSLCACEYNPQFPSAVQWDTVA